MRIAYQTLPIRNRDNSLPVKPPIHTKPTLCQIQLIYYPRSFLALFWDSVYAQVD
jgi:hypothetical protein